MRTHRLGLPLSGLWLANFTAKATVAIAVGDNDVPVEVVKVVKGVIAVKIAKGTFATQQAALAFKVTDGGRTAYTQPFSMKAPVEVKSVTAKIGRDVQGRVTLVTAPIQHGTNVEKILEALPDEQDQPTDKAKVDIEVEASRE